MIAEVIRGGFLTTVQDLGRTGFRELGVSLGGALDPFALRVANSLVGNDSSLAGLEITLGGLDLRFADQRIIAWCGGESDVRIGSTSVPPGHSIFVQAGERVKFAPAKIGSRCWLAVSGGIDVPLLLGSRSTDLRSSFGGLEGRAVRDGDKPPLGRNSNSSQILIANLRETKIGSWSSSRSWSSTAQPRPTLRFVRGADWSQFGDLMIKRFTNEAFAVLSDSDRMGVRLEGAELERENGVDLISEAVAPGTVQVPPSGRPILLLGDCQTIGGYPKIAHVITVDLATAAQLRATDCVRFCEVSLAEAHRLLIEREQDFEQFRCGLATRY